MQVKILGTESLGVRGMSCLVTTEDRSIVIDPGLALGYKRFGLLPHPYQVAEGVRIRGRIIDALKTATDVIISHYHGDHIPLADANPYQLSFSQIPPFNNTRLWCKGPKQISSRSLKRRFDLESFAGHPIMNAEGHGDDTICCSHPVFHGSAESHTGTVMMTRIEERDEVFVHASDIQLLNRAAADTIVSWKPDIVIMSGPPLYLDFVTKKLLKVALDNALLLSKHADILIIDHHLLRSPDGLRWLEKLADNAACTVMSAAEFMGKKPRLLEARRRELYDLMPVPFGWHEDYATGTAGFEEYVQKCPLFD